MKNKLISRNIDENKIGICEPGIDQELMVLDASRPSRCRQGHSLNLLTVANASKLKGLDWLMNTLLELDCGSWQWHVVGTVDPQSRLAAECGRIVLHGSLERAQLRTKYRNADLFLFPSFSESYGMAVADALAAGVPVIANKVGAAPQLVINGETGYLCDPGNRSQWSAALKRLLTDDEERSRLTNNALSSRESLPRWSEAADKYLAFLRSFKKARMI
jgi:glycosyltransferase involved in cell wall biosynthesis